MELHIELRGPRSLREQQQHRSGEHYSWPVIGGIILLVVVVSGGLPSYQGPTITPDPKPKPGDPTVMVKGSAPEGSNEVTIVRNGYAWKERVSDEGFFIASVPLEPGPNRIAAWANGHSSKAIVVVGPPATNPSTGTPLSGDCVGTIRAFPTSGYQGDPISITVQIDPAASSVAVERVIVDCHVDLGDGGRYTTCPVPRTGANQFANLFYYRRNTDEANFYAYDKDGKIRCNGSITLTPLGERP
jgi:hypothetical protein